MNLKFKPLLAVFLSAFALNVFAGPDDDLIAACKAGDLEGVKKAISAGAKVNNLDAAGNPAITAATFWPEIVKFLLENGADPNLGKTTVLFSAACGYSYDVMKLVLDAGADPNKPSISDPKAIFTTLIAKEKSKGKDANQAMIKAWEGAMASMKPTDIYTLPTLVAGTNCVPCLQLMLDKGAKIDKGVTDGTLLHTFAGSGMSREDRKKGFAAGKANMEAFGLKMPDWYSNLPDNLNGTPEDMLKVLLSKGLNINEKNKGAGGIPPQTPLEVSLGGGLLNKPAVSVALINNGADVKVGSDWYGPVIIQAAELGSVDVLKAMIEKGADINAKGKAFLDTDNGADIKNHTPLTAAAMKNNLDAVKFLLDKGAKADGISGTIISGSCPGNLDNKSAIYFAIEHKNMEMVKYIAEHNGFNGKDLSISRKRMTNCVGGGSYSPSKYAKEMDLAEIKDYLKSKGF